MKVNIKNQSSQVYVLYNMILEHREREEEKKKQELKGLPPTPILNSPRKDSLKRSSPPASPSKNKLTSRNFFKSIFGKPLPQNSTENTPKIIVETKDLTNNINNNNTKSEDTDPSIIELNRNRSSSM